MRTSRFVWCSMAAVLVAVCAMSVADAQPPGGGRGERGGQRGGGRGGFGGPPRPVSISKAQLLRSEDVQEDLNISEAQSETIKAALESFREEQGGAFGRGGERPDFRSMSEEERREFFEKMQKQREELTQKTDEIVVALLEKDQVRRLDQIGLQIKLRMAMLPTLKSDEMKKELSLTDEQLAKLEATEEEIQEAQQKMREEMFARFRGNEGGERPDFGAIREKFEAARKDSEKKILAVLTEEQQKKLDELKGQPLDVDMRAFQRGGFGGGRGGDGRGGEGRRRGDRGDGEGRGRRRPAADDDN